LDLDLAHSQGTPNETAIRAQLTAELENQKAELEYQKAVIYKETFGIYFEFFVLIFNWQFYVF